MTHFIVGDLIACNGTIQSTGNPLDVTFTLLKPDGTKVTYKHLDDPLTVKRLAPGRFRTEIDADQKGTYVYRYESAAPFKGAQKKTFHVRSAL